MVKARTSKRPKKLKKNKSKWKPAKKQRNYKKEYKQRIAHGRAGGLSLSEARGHSKHKAVRPIKEAQFQIGLQLLDRGDSLATIADKLHVSKERFLNYALKKGVIEKHGKKWRLKKRLSRRVLIYSNGQLQIITVSEAMASYVGQYMAALRWFVTTGKETYLIPFVGKFVTDINGKKYLLETRPNVIHRLAHAGGTSFEQVYAITV